MPKSLKIGSTQFVDVLDDDGSNPVLAVCPFGLDTSGKTRLIATAPDPIGAIPLERKSRPTLKAVAKEFGKHIIMPKEDFIRHENPMKIARMDETQAKTYYSEHVKAILGAAYDLLNNPDIRTIAIDSGSQLWENILFSHFGRKDQIKPVLRGGANQDMIDFLNAVTTKHLIITHRAKQVWENEKPVKDKYEIEGFNRIGYYTTVVCEMKRNEKFGGTNGWQFAMDIRSCQARALLQGPLGKNALTDLWISFPMLAARIWGDEDWFDPEEYGWNGKMKEELAGVVEQMAEDEEDLEEWQEEVCEKML